MKILTNEQYMDILSTYHECECISFAIVRDEVRYTIEGHCEESYMSLLELNNLI